jgi:hypothetical protein
MELLRWKTRLAVLWIILAVGFSAYMFLRFLEPGIIEGIISGQFGKNQSQLSEGYLFYLAIFWFIPMIMAFLSLTLKDSANRWTNFVLGIILVLAFIYGLVESASRGHSAAVLVDKSIGLAAAALIAWHGWKWPKQKE